MRLTTPSELDYALGDVVWVRWSFGRRRRAEVVKVEHFVRVRFDDGDTYWAPRDYLRPYDAIDQLADLVSCGTCGQRPPDCRCYRISTTPCGSTDGMFTMTYGASASNLDAVTQLGKLARQRGRRPLTASERARRRSRRRMAKLSRRRNR